MATSVPTVAASAPAATLPLPLFWWLGRLVRWIVNIWESINNFFRLLRQIEGFFRQAMSRPPPPQEKASPVPQKKVQAMPDLVLPARRAHLQDATDLCAKAWKDGKDAKRAQHVKECLKAGDVAAATRTLALITRAADRAAALHHFGSYYLQQQQRDKALEQIRQIEVLKPAGEVDAAMVRSHLRQLKRQAGVK